MWETGHVVVGFQLCLFGGAVLRWPCWFFGHWFAGFQLCLFGGAAVPVAMWDFGHVVAGFQLCLFGGAAVRVAMWISAIGLPVSSFGWLWTASGQPGVPLVITSQ